jgi:CTP synthase
LCEVSPQGVTARKIQIPFLSVGADLSFFVGAALSWVAAGFFIFWEGFDMKYIFVTGGVVSGLGKGICAASLGRLLKQRGLRVRNQKFDPYLNVDPGTMSPYQHGEVFVTDDGAETDLDLGHYERFVDEDLTGESSVSSGKIYWSVLNREREGGYLGGTVQIIPHVTDEIKRRIYAMEKPDLDVAICEIGGTVGDIESQPFLEAIRQVANEKGRSQVLFIHVSLIVEIPGSGELKSKPTQHSVKELLSIGIQPDVLVCRSNAPLTDDVKGKISLFCNVEPDSVISNLTASTLYEVPLMLEQEGLADVVCRKLSLPAGKPELENWRAMVQRIKNARKHVTIALVGKYTQLHDAYLSVVESLSHAGTANDAIVHIRWIDSETVTPDTAESLLGGCDGILVPGGFGDRGIEGMILAAQYAREHRLPYFGICLGMQIAVIEFARHKLGWADANSAEFAPQSLHPVIALMSDQVGVTAKGGTMRLGHYPCVLQEDTRARALYGTEEISERHRHRYEFNNDFREALTGAGLITAGLSPDGHLVEICEEPDQPWFVGVQFHPEFKSRPDRPHPLFFGFIEAAVQQTAQ